MAGQGISSGAIAFKESFVTLAQGLYTGDIAAPVEVLVIGGIPGTYMPSDIVAFLGLRSDQDYAAMGTNRSRDEIIQLDAFLSVERGGKDPATDAVCERRVSDLLTVIEHFARVTDTTIGNTVRECFLLKHELVTTPSKNGRESYINATFQAKFRITS
ncbi:MAG: hypothetical protein ABJB03_00520 [Rhodoglobus sp.]